MLFYPLLLLFSWCVFVWNARGAFSLGFMGEDFAWLLWAKKATLVNALVPAPQVYFRPLSVQLPYFLFSHSSSGLLCWKVCAFMAVGAGTLFLHLWLERITKNSLAAFLFALLWLFCPLQAFAVYYPNAFDYALFPCLFFAFLWSLESGRWVTLFAVLGLLSKELALIYPLLALAAWRGRKVTGRQAIFVCAAAAVFLLWRATGGERLASFGGFGWDISLVTWMGNFGELLLNTFWRPFARSETLAWSWAVVFWVAIAAGLVWRVAAARALQPSWWPAFLLASVFCPLILVNNLKSLHLGLLFLPLIPAIVLASAGKSAPGLMRYLYVACVIVLISCNFFFWWQAEFPFRQQHQESVAMLGAASGPLEKCRAGSQVVVDGFQKLFHDQTGAEHALWALRWKHPSLKLFLLANRGHSEDEVIYPHLEMWVAPELAVGTTILTFEKDGNATRATSLKPGAGCDG